MRLLCRWTGLITWLAAAVALGAMAVAPARAQLTFSDDAYWVVTPASRYVTGKLGVSGWVKASPSSVQMDIPGRYAVVSEGGDPEVSADDTREINYWGSIAPCYYFGYWKVKIGDKVNFVGDSNTGYWSKTPFTYVTPPPGYGVGRAGGFIQGEWTITDGGKAVAAFSIKMSLVRDQVRFELLATNKAATAQNIGVQMIGDVEVSPSITVGYPYIAGIGFSRQPAVLVRPQGILLGGANVPEMFEIMDSVDSPGTVARCCLRLQDCVAPDYVAIGEYREIAAVATTMWLPNDYNPDPLKPVNDLSWALCWSPKALGAGAARKIVTYYGIGAASSVWNYRVGSQMVQDSVSLAVQGPRSLKYNTVNGLNDIDAQPFNIKAYVYNLATDPGPYNLDNVTLTLYLPPGLELAPVVPPQTAQQAIGRVSVNSEAAPAAWQVQATGEYSGELQYFITARASSGWQQVVSRTVMVPATKRNVFRSGYQLIHVPFTFNNLAVEHAFGLPRGSFGAKYYDPVSGQYLPVTQLEPGQAFWMYVGNVARGQTLPFRLAADAAIVGQQLGKQLDEQDIDLRPGWNLVGNPFVYPVYWGQVLVWNKVGNTTVSLDQAVTNGWLSKTLFTWIPESGTYESFNKSDRLLLPWRGYWVLAKYPVTLVFRPAVPPGSDATANADGT